MHIPLRNRSTLTIPNAVTMPGATNNLLSVSQLAENNEVIFQQQEAYITAPQPPPDKTIIRATAPRKNKLYFLPSHSQPPTTSNPSISSRPPIPKHSPTKPQHTGHSGTNNRAIYRPECHGARTHTKTAALDKKVPQTLHPPVSAPPPAFRSRLMSYRLAVLADRGVSLPYWVPT